jgi:3-methyladenine DNA glycosylase AlkD
MDEELIEALVEDAERLLSAAADPSKAPEMAAYMKTEMPFWGVQAKARDAIVARLKRDHPITDGDTYEGAVRALWAGERREDRYVAVRLARAHARFVTLERLGLYEELVREGAWWDFVDEIAINLVGALARSHPGEVLPIMDAWVEDDFMWIRRAGLLSQLKSKAATDADRLFAHCDALLGEEEFFIRKAIGWALREYSRTAPDDVADYLTRRKSRLSGLSYREGARLLKKAGKM